MSDPTTAPLNGEAAPSGPQPLPLMRFPTGIPAIVKGIPLVEILRTLDVGNLLQSVGITGVQGFRDGGAAGMMMEIQTADATVTEPLVRAGMQLLVGAVNNHADTVIAQRAAAAQAAAPPPVPPMPTAPVQQQPQMQPPQYAQPQMQPPQQYGLPPSNYAPGPYSNGQPAQFGNGNGPVRGQLDPHMGQPAQQFGNGQPFDARMHAPTPPSRTYVPPQAQDAVQDEPLHLMLDSLSAHEWDVIGDRFLARFMTAVGGLERTYKGRIDFDPATGTIAAAIGPVQNEQLQPTVCVTTFARDGGLGTLCRSAVRQLQAQGQGARR